jgi:hypothetical protein
MSDYIDKMKFKALQTLKNSLPEYVKLDESTYTHTHNKARFIDEKYGEWWAFPLNVARGHLHKNRGREKSSAKKLNETLKRYTLPKGISIDISTFYGLNKKARFIDEQYGEWWTTARNVLEKRCGHPNGKMSKMKSTMEKRYGISHTMQSDAFFSKSMKSQLKSTNMIHWKTSEVLCCVGSYENFVVDYLNKNMIDFSWQKDVFIMPDGRTYRPDFFLEKENVYVEIKGHFWKDAQEKWDWFKIVHANSELWDLSKLKTLGYKRTRKND